MQFIGKVTISHYALTPRARRKSEVSKVSWSTKKISSVTAKQCSPKKKK